MFRDYCKTAWRNFSRNRVQAFINLAGLSVSMAACLLILQYVSFQFSFDRFNKHAEDLYRVTNDRYQNGKLVQHGTITYSGISKALLTDYPEVMSATRVEPFAQQIVGNGDKKEGDLAALAVDNSFLSMFSYPMLTGDKTGGLKEPNSAILTASLADKLFGPQRGNYQSLIGKTILISRNPTPYKITAICADVPQNSHLNFDFLVSYNSLYMGGAEKWSQADYDFTDSDFWHYIQLKHGTDYKALQAKLGAFSQKYFKGNKVSGSDEKFYLQPLLKAHLYSDYEYEIGKTGNATAVWGLGVVALMIIVIAWINYVNLSTANSLKRAKEVGIRKVTGATRGQLIRQFLTESLILNVLALVVALCIVWLVQGGFNELVQQPLSISYLFGNGLNGYSLLLPLFLFLLLGMAGSGFYPAFVLSAFKPVSVLKGKFASSTKGILLRKVLVVGQFTVTIILIISSLVVYRQINFVNGQSLGIDLSQMLIVKPPLLTGWDSSFIDKENSFKNELAQLPHVHGASAVGKTAGDELSRAFDVHRADKQDNNVTMRNVSVDADFVKVFGAKIVAGRNFTTTDYNPDGNKLHSFVLNESAVKRLGFSSPADAIGKQIQFGAGDKAWDIVGVVNDFHQKSLHYSIEPTILVPSYGTDNPICVKVDTKDLPATLAAVKAKYEAFFPNNFFDYYFLDEKFNKQYSDDLLFQEVFSLFSGFAICIACLGLLGLSLFATAQRTKEIGVRKVLGASVASIVALLSKDFIRLVVVAILIASPAAYYIMHTWLKGFAYRISISPWLFVAAGLLAVVTAVLTISFQSIKAAIANPVKSLRTE